MTPKPKPRGRAPKKYTRYDPLSGRKVKVFESDPRFEEWPSRKPSKKAKTEARIEAVAGGVGLGKESAKALGAVGTALAPAVARQIPKAVRALTAQRAVGAGIWAGSTVGGAGIPALLAAVGLASYFTTKWIINNFPTKERRIEAAWKLYIEATQKMRQKLGRELTLDERREMAQRWKAIQADIKQSPI